MALQYLGRVYTKLKGVMKGLSGQIASPSVQQYVIDGRLSTDITIQSLGLQTSAGTVTASLKINGVAIPGLTAVTGTSAAPMLVFQATGGNVALAGSTLILDVTAVASGANLDVSIHYTEN